MKAFINGFGRLCAIGVAVYCNSLIAWGHDLPHDRGLPDQATLNCFSAVSHQSDSATPDSCAPAIAAPTHKKQFTDFLGDQVLLSELPFSSTSASLLHAWQSISSKANLALTSVVRSLNRTRLPDKSPQLTAACDLAISPPADGVPPRPRAKAVAGHADALAQFLKQIEDAQCQASQAFHDRASLQQSIAEHTHNWYRTVNSLVAKFATPKTAPANRPLSTGLQYVIFETATGGHIVLTVVQARQWQFAVPAAKNSLAKFLTATAESTQQAFAAISGQLDWACKSVLGLSQTVSQFTHAKVADRSSSYH